ncbi:MAG: hypothetical protein ACK2T3_13450 [Candidatus Promineifilaceae bacterium]
MKKSLVLIGLAALLLAACGSTTSDEPALAASEASTVTVFRTPF